jgi:hypothetical protein
MYNMTEFILIGFIVVLLVNLTFTHRLYSKVEKLQKENDNLKLIADKTLKDAEELVSIEPGDKAILPDYGLQHADTKESFSITYEVEVVEVSLDKVKVKAINFTSEDKFAKDPRNKSAIINFLQNKWVKKDSIELIIDDSMRRDRKLQQILG